MDKVSSPSLQTPPSASVGAPVLPVESVPVAPIPIVSTSRAIIASVSMAILFVLGLALIQILFRRATPDADNIVLALEYCSMAAGYSLLALPMWGIFDTLRRTRLYVMGPKYVIAFGYICVMGTLLYFAYKLVIWCLNIVF